MVMVGIECAPAGRGDYERRWLPTEAAWDVRITTMQGETACAKANIDDTAKLEN